MRRISLVALLLLASIVLSACIRQEGALAINPDASISGTVVLGLERQLAASLGISSLDDAIKNQTGLVASKDGCFEVKSEETPTEYVFTCRYKDSKIISGDMTSTVENNKIVFTFKSNADSDPNSSSLNLGKVVLGVQFPGAIESIQENRPGITRKDGDNRVKIEGYASEPINIRITSSCGTSCSMDLTELIKSFASAPSNFGGMIRTDTVMRKVNSPFRVKETIQVPLGRTLVVEPGVEIIADLGSISDFMSRSLFFNQGRLIFAGREDGRIRITGKPDIVVRTSGSTGSSTTEARFTEFVDAGYLVYNYDTGGEGVFSVSDSLLTGLRNTWYIGYPKNVVFVERNVFVNSAGIEIVTRAPEGSTLPSVNVRHNVFLGAPVDARSAAPSGCWISTRATYSTKVIVENNDFSQAPRRAICIGSERNIAVDASLNFWGTTNLNEIEDRIFDSSDDLTASSKVIIGKPLDRSPLDTEPQLRSLANYVSLVKKNAHAAAAKPKATDQKSKKVTTKRITCTKGKTKLKVIGKNPKCPAGYRAN